MAGFVALFPQLDHGFDPQKKILVYFVSICCNFLDLIAFHSGSLEDIACFSLWLLFFARGANLRAYGFLNILLI